MGMDAQTNLFPSALLNFTGNVFPTDIDVIDLHTALWPLKFESAKKQKTEDRMERRCFFDTHLAAVPSQLLSIGGLDATVAAADRFVASHEPKP